MDAIRTIADASSGTIRLDLPADFHAKKVEIIILPYQECNIGLPELLLRAPTLSDEELTGFFSVKEWMNQWTANSY